MTQAQPFPLASSQPLFPDVGAQYTLATYSVAARQFSYSLVSVALDAPTPINLAQHIYWNLDAFTAPDVLAQTLHLPYALRIIGSDNIQVPTGALETVAGTAFDFTSPKPIGQDIQRADQCGFNCTGYDNAFIMDRPRYAGVESTDLTLLSISSPATGIRMDVKTNQQSIQFYSCIGQNGTIPVKQSQQHGNATRAVEKFGCVSGPLHPPLEGWDMLTRLGTQTVFETQQWIDGINHPGSKFSFRLAAMLANKTSAEWGQDSYQIYTPSTPPAVNWAQYDFSIIS